MKNIYLLVISILISGCSPDSETELPKSEDFNNIVGTWKVIESTLVPFEHVSFCRKLEIGAIFKFDKSGSLTVYEDSNSKENCNTNQSFWLKSGELKILEHDFIFGYKILKLDRDSLSIWTNKIPAYFHEDSNPVFDSPGNVLKFKNEGITIKMKKIRDGG